MTAAIYEKNGPRPFLLMSYTDCSFTVLNPVVSLHARSARMRPQKMPTTTGDELDCTIGDLLQR